jgi:hypothetical protein
MPRIGYTDVSLNIGWPASMPVNFNELLDAYQFISMAGPDQNEAFVCLQSGKVYWRSELLGEADPELPDDIEDDEKYIQVPHKKELDLGSPLVFAFTRKFLPDDYGKVRDIFGRRGAYAAFKGLLSSRGILEQWYEFESKAEEEALRNWCNLNSMELTG